MEKMEREQTQNIVGHVVLISIIPVWLVDLSRIQRITTNKQQQQIGGTDPSATYISENDGVGGMTKWLKK
jgi:preprotein translocase subunit SecA